MIEGKTLRLGWDKYLDVIEPGAEVWVYFHGPHKFQNGVYVKGSVEDVDLDQRAAFIRVRQHSTGTPLTDSGTSARLAQAVAVRYRQVFVLPDDLQTGASCNITTSADSCRQHLCDGCQTWEALPLVSPDELIMPARLEGKLDGYVPAYWVIPPRTFLYYTGRPIKAAVRRTSDIFYDFKTGGKNLSYPLALGMFNALAKAEQLMAECIIPIPLSPDKAEKGELNRTLTLARTLSPMLKPPVAECLALNTPISKRILRGVYRYSAAEFENAYGSALIVKSLPSGTKSALLLDDVCTEGSTLRAAAIALKATHPGLTLTAVTAGQMTVKSVVRDEDLLLA